MNAVRFKISSFYDAYVSLKVSLPIVKILTLWPHEYDPLEHPPIRPCASFGFFYSFDLLG